MVVDDVAHVEEAIPGMQITRLDRGRNETELMLVELPAIGLCVGRFDFKVSSEAGFDGDSVRIGLQLDEGLGRTAFERASPSRNPQNGRCSVWRGSSPKWAR